MRYEERADAKEVCIRNEVMYVYSGHKRHYPSYANLSDALYSSAVQT